MVIFKIGQFAELTGVSIYTLRRWDNLGVLKAHRTPAGTRFYTEEQLNEFRKGMVGYAKFN